MASRLDQRLGGLRSYRFDRGHDLVGPTGGAPEIRLVRPAGFQGSEDSATQDTLTCYSCRMAVYLSADRPVDLRELGEILENVRVIDLLDPRGPVDVPRLFIGSEKDWQFASENTTDLSRLRNIARRLPRREKQ